MVILQASGRFLQEYAYSCKIGARILQDNNFSARILQDNHFSARILQDSNFFCQNLAR